MQDKQRFREIVKEMIGDIDSMSAEELIADLQAVECTGIGEAFDSQVISDLIRRENEQ